MTTAFLADWNLKLSKMSQSASFQSRRCHCRLCVNCENTKQGRFGKIDVFPKLKEFSTLLLRIWQQYWQIIDIHSCNTFCRHTPHTQVPHCWHCTLAHLFHATEHIPHAYYCTYNIFFIYDLWKFWILSSVMFFLCFYAARRKHVQA